MQGPIPTACPVQPQVLIDAVPIDVEGRQHDARVDHRVENVEGHRQAKDAGRRFSNGDDMGGVGCFRALQKPSCRTTHMLSTLQLLSLRPRCKSDARPAGTGTDS